MNADRSPSLKRPALTCRVVGSAPCAPSRGARGVRALRSAPRHGLQMPIRRRPRSRLLVASLLVVQACGAGWRRPSDGSLAAVEPRQQVQVWRDGRAVRWHAVVVSADSISGIAFHRPMDCDSCRTAVPRGTVDSLRFGNPVTAFWNTVGLVVGGTLAVLAFGCRKGCDLQ